MNIASHSTQQRRLNHRQRKERRGVALVFVLVFVIAMAALAMSSIFMASNANLLAKSYDRERDLKYAADAALAIGTSRVNADPTILTMQVNQVDTAILVNQPLMDATGHALPGVNVSVYVGPTGSTSGQFGRFSSIVAVARDQRGNAFIRRLELVQESFAKFAYWSNSENNGATQIFFGNHDELWGPVWSNDTIAINSGTAIFHDVVGTVYYVIGQNYGTFSKGLLINQKPIPLPSTSQLLTLSTIATTEGWNFPTAQPASNTETSVRDRIEFIASDLNNSGDSTDLNEGLFRFYTAKSGNDTKLRGDWPGTYTTPPTIAQTNFCGDWHYGPKDANNNVYLQFFPASVHPTHWFKLLVQQGYLDHGGYTAPQALTAANADSSANLKSILTGPNARCYLAGDPHLAAIERVGQIDPKTSAVYVTTSIQRGGFDTTFTPNGVYGSWKLNPATPDTLIARLHPWDAHYIYPIDRGFNTNAKGVIYANGNVGVSGTLNGRVTLYAAGTIVLLDDLRYANDPVKGVCRDILGLISSKDIVIADNAINDPPLIAAGTNASMDDTKDVYIHGVMMALGTSFRVENYNLGPTAVNNCGATINGRGCIYLSGGLIQNSRGAVGTSGGSGFAKQYTYDHCAIVNPPPYFPTTGRFQDNRYLELDPTGFNDKTYFQTLVPPP
jgi:hypothetical protein